MSFDLRIFFSGLCVFIPDDQRMRMHVLMPSTRGDCENGHTLHLARLRYDVAYAIPGATKLTGDCAYRVLEDKALDLVEFPGELNMQLPPDLVDVERPAGKKVPRNRLSVQRPPKVDSRVTLSAGAVTCRVPGAIFEFDGSEPRHLAHVVVWTIPNIEGNELRLRLKKLHGAGEEPLPVLHPIGGTVDLGVLHVVPEELDPGAPLPDPPEPGTEIHHFEAYYCVFDSPERRPLPKYLEEGNPICEPMQEGMLAAPLAFRGGSPFFCMGSRASLEPEA